MRDLRRRRVHATQEKQFYGTLQSVDIISLAIFRIRAREKEAVDSAAASAFETTAATDGRCGGGNAAKRPPLLDGRRRRRGKEGRKEGREILVKSSIVWTVALVRSFVPSGEGSDGGGGG